jgi:hypothetical protein
VFYPPRVLAVALALALGLPQPGVLVAGASLGGVRLGSTETQVRRSWGPRVGVCRGCARRTLYFTYARFDQVGTGAEFVRGRAVALYTLWSPTGWRTDRGVRLGDPELRVVSEHRGLSRTECGHYEALSARRGRVVTVFWFRDGILWAFGIQRPSVPLCR